MPRLLKRSLVIFSGGKLENRKGQDIVIAAFRRLLRYLPDALLIAAWGNVGHVALNTIATSSHVQGAPERGRAHEIGPWLEANGVPATNVFILPCVVNRQLPHLIKQADVAVFASRCEGGTNLMAMETLACGLPTLISANTGHLDLLAMGFGHALSVGHRGVGKVAPDVLKAYGGDPLGLWGETDPDELLHWWLRIAAEREAWRCLGRKHASEIRSLSWRESMRKLLQLLEELPPFVNAPLVHPDSVLLITLDSCRYDSYRRSITPAMDLVGPLHLALAPSHFTFGSHSSIFKGFLPSVRASKPLLNSKLAKLFRLAHAGWPGKECEEFQLQGPSIIEGSVGLATAQSAVVLWDGLIQTQKLVNASQLNLTSFSIQEYLAAG